jgi:hypothetical protein
MTLRSAVERSYASIGLHATGDEESETDDEECVTDDDEEKETKQITEETNIYTFDINKCSKNQMATPRSNLVYITLFPLYISPSWVWMAFASNG